MTVQSRRAAAGRWLVGLVVITAVACAGGAHHHHRRIDEGLLATTERTDDTIQVTYNGHPLYHFAGDEAPGDTNGQNVGDVWFVVSPEGEALTAARRRTANTELGAPGQTGAFRTASVWSGRRARRRCRSRRPPSAEAEDLVRRRTGGRGAIGGVKGAVAHRHRPVVLRPVCSGHALERGVLTHLRRVALDDQIEVVASDRDGTTRVVFEVPGLTHSSSWLCTSRRPPIRPAPV